MKAPSLFFTSLKEISEQAPEGATHFRWSKTVKQFRADYCPAAIPVADAEKARIPVDLPHFRIRYYDSAAEVGGPPIGKSQRTKQREDEGLADAIVMKPGAMIPDPEVTMLSVPGLPDSAPDVSDTDPTKGAIQAQTVSNSQARWGVAFGASVLRDEMNFWKEQAAHLRMALDERGTDSIYGLLQSTEGSKNAIAMIETIGAQLERLSGRQAVDVKGITEAVTEAVREHVAPIQLEVQKRLDAIEARIPSASPPVDKK